jgi:hypothetical protein
MQSRPTAQPDTEALSRQVIQEQFDGDCELPETGDQFSHHENAFAKVQQYSFPEKRRECWKMHRKPKICRPRLSIAPARLQATTESPAKKKPRVIDLSQEAVAREYLPAETQGTQDMDLCLGGSL